MKQLIAAIAALFLLSGCEQAAQANTASVEPKTPSATQPAVKQGYQLLFFLNPNGRPCQMQNRILKEMGSSLTDKADLIYLSTTKLEQTKPYFNKYGIRALPSLVVLDGNGQVVKRFAPGIQSKESILQALDS